MAMDYDWNAAFFEAVVKVNVSSSAYSYSASEPFGPAGRLSKVEREFLGSLKGLHVLQFMSHLGAESTAMAALGATVTGIDLNVQAIKEARRRAQSLGSKVDFILGDCLEADVVMRGRSFDMVYIGLGSLGWTSNLRQLFRAAYNCLKPQGSLNIFEVHPVAQAASSAEKSRDSRAERYHIPEFGVPVECEYRISWTGDPSYGRIERFFIWRHRTCDILQSLIDVGFYTTHFEEHSYTTYRQFEDMTVKENGMWGFSRERHFPLSISISASKSRLAKLRQRVVMPSR